MKTKPIDQIDDGSKLSMLPNRRVVNQLKGGEAWQRNINNYAKVTPTGASGLDAPGVMQMAQVKY